MGLVSDRVLMQTLTAAGVGTVSSGWFDLSSYRAGAFYVVVTVGGTLTPNFHTSPDSGTTDTGLISTGELAAPGAQAGAGGLRYPFLIPMQMPWVRVNSVISVSAVTGVVYFIGRS